MATKEEIETEYPPSPDQYSGDENSLGTQESEPEETEEPESPPDDKDNVARILKQLQSSGALVKKAAGGASTAPPVVVPVAPYSAVPATTYAAVRAAPSTAIPAALSAAIPAAPSPAIKQRCVTCDLTFPNWSELEDHLIQHVSLPKVLVHRLPSDDESEPDHEPGDEDWSDEEEGDRKPKVDVSELIKNKYLSIKKTNDTSPAKAPDSALTKLAGLGGFTIKKNNTPIKNEERDDDEKKDDLMQKLGKLGALKLKLQTTSQGDQNSFKVINGLKEFNADDDEDDWSGREDADTDHDKSDEAQAPSVEPNTTESSGLSPSKNSPQTTPQTTPVKASPNIKVVKVLRILPKTGQNPSAMSAAPVSTPPTSQSVTMSNTVVKDEPLGDNDQSPNPGFPGFPLFSSQTVKRECPTPPLSEISSIISTGTTIKTETDAYYASGNSTSTVQITEVTDTPIEPKKEKNTDPVAIIEINGDSNDDDDDCCVVSATPAADIKPKIENTYNPALSAAYTVQSTQASTMPTMLTARLGGPGSYSTEKQHNFNWNAPDQKPQVEIIEKSADAIFESLLASSNQKKESNISISDASEYISLDRLGPQHTCEVCNSRYTDLSHLENHRRATGHSKSLVAPAGTALLPAYSSSNSLISSLFPVKQLAEQVGRLSAVGTNNTSPFTHQQNVMINIQAYPGQLGSGMMAAPQQYAGYPGQQASMPGAGYQPAPNPNMYRMPGQTMPPPGQNYAGPYPPNQYPPQSYAVVSTPAGFMSMGGAPAYSTSPLQGMQQAVYGQGGSPQPIPGLGGVAPGQLGSPQHQQFATPSSPNSMKPPPPPGNIRIQNVQSFSPGAPGAGQPMRGAAPMRGGARPRMPGVRPGMRPSIRPGVQVQGAVRGGKGPRMPMKRPGGGAPGGGPGKKRMDMLLPGKHDNEDCTVMAMQKQRDGLPMIHSVQGSKDNFNLGNQLSITKKTVNKEASGMASLLAARGIMVKQKAKSRSPSPERPVPHIPNLGAGMSIKATSRSSEFSIPEAKVGGGMNQCRICRKMFMNQNSLSVHMSTAHPNSKVPMYKCEECPASYPKAGQLQHHRRVFHNVSGPDRELGLPVVDLSQEENLKRLSDLGIYSFIPLANREQASGCFGIPVISVHNMNNGIVRGLTALGADGLLSLGPLKPLPNT